MPSPRENLKGKLKNLGGSLYTTVSRKAAECSRGKRKSTREKGLKAEELAARLLEKRGYQIIERNFTCKSGEIDIIARNGGELVFIEVRSRGSADSLNPVHSIGPHKQRKISRAAEHYLTANLRIVPPCRFDVVTVTIGDTPSIEVIRNAFDSCGRGV